MNDIIFSPLSAVRELRLPRHARDDGEVVVAEAATGVPFAIARLFVLRAPGGAVRGDHAHRLCTQFVILLNGSVEISIEDGTSRRTISMDSSDQALFVPPMIWTKVRFVEPQSVVGVLCDRPYEPEDYVHEYPHFMLLRQGGGA